MKKIQLDMFEVQLGAAILLQFWVGNRVVRVLADAGVNAKGYPPEHVRDRLKPILKASGNNKIDLVIGTHYDEDHLNGLVPIIEDQEIEISEAWLPPVANDHKRYAIDLSPAPDQLLSSQFENDDGKLVLAQYLAAERHSYETLNTMVREKQPERLPKPSLGMLAQRDDGQRISNHIEFFRTQLSELLPEGTCFHGSEQETENPFPGNLTMQTPPSLKRQWKKLRDNLTNESDVGEAQLRTLANMRVASAKKGINAKALFEVVQALKNRKVPIRSEIIEDGKPRLYSWQPKTGQFMAGGPRHDLSFVLLGPSHSLVKKHRNKLPDLTYLNVAMKTLGELKSITPSNQLSYIARFEFADQAVLITGDAGCVDFKMNGKEYFPDLLAALLPLHVIQVAHHAGANAHFYRVLEAAGFPAQNDNSLLLLSHAEDDIYRPSAAFGHFITNVLAKGDDTKLLFTSEPTAAKVKNYKAAIHPQVGTSGKVGDVRIEFEGGGWKVKSHAIKV